MRRWCLTASGAGWRGVLAALVVTMGLAFALQIAASPSAEARGKSQVDTSCLKRSDYYRGQRGGGCRAAFGRSGVAYDLCEAQHRNLSACYGQLNTCLARVGTVEGLFTSCNVCRVRYHGCIDEARDASRNEYFRWRK